MQYNPGQLTQTNGNPILPGTAFTGPVLVGNVLNGSGSGSLAAAGELQGSTANAGILMACQSQAGILQSGTPVTTNIVIPAQSRIARITGMVTTAASGASAFFGIGTSVSATALTAAAVADGSILGQVVLTPGSNGTRIGTWDNVGTTDIQIVVTFANTGNGVLTLSVEYEQGVNLAS